jgi:hypothetical protein
MVDGAGAGASAGAPPASRTVVPLKSVPPEWKASAPLLPAATATKKTAAAKKSDDPFPMEEVETGTFRSF